MRSIIKEIIEDNEKWKDLDYCLRIVKKNWMRILYTRIQTLEICMAAVKKSGNALQHVKIQTPEICAAAIKQNPEAYTYVKLPEDEDKKDKFLRELGLQLLST